MNQPMAPDDTRDTLRTLGGLLVGLAAAMIFIRKNNGPGHWAAFPMFLDLAVPAVLLYGAVLTRPQTGVLRPWQVVLSVFGLIFVPLALLKFVVVLGGSGSASLNVFWVFGVTAALAAYAGGVLGVRVQLLLAAIAAIISWSALWNKLLSSGISHHFGTYRGLLGVLAIGLLAAALYVWRTNPGGDEVAETATAPSGDLGLWKASELFTGAGIAAVTACGLGITSLVRLNPLATAQFTGIHTTGLWDLLLLLVSLGLVVIAGWIGTRGPAYVGGIGLLLFIVIAGEDLNNTPPHPFKFGLWPWVLVILGLIALALSARPEASLGDQPRRFIENLRRR
jgi:hypothetical protein